MLRLIIAALIILSSTLFAQDSYDDFSGNVITGKLIKITDNHIVFQSDDRADSQPQYLKKDWVKKVTLSDGSIAFEDNKTFVPWESSNMKSPSLEKSMDRLARAQERIAKIAATWQVIYIGSLIVYVFVIIL